MEPIRDKTKESRYYPHALWEFWRETAHGQSERAFKSDIKWCKLLFEHGVIEDGGVNSVGWPMVRITQHGKDEMWRVHGRRFKADVQKRRDEFAALANMAALGN